MISSETHTMHTLRESNNIVLIEIRQDDAVAQRSMRFYVVEHVSGTNQVKSIIPADCPPRGQWYAGFSPFGVHYVACGRTRNAAMKWFRRLSASVD